ncbi:M20 metallopeptidase family protein [Jeotgalibacillus proteolyticus]|uniref:Amidohydrolase n=1 Tax=Jeotgalibacillus proteolyticus TaxID=2082395 RepID=A0A2S5G8Q1_9BACL|nr:amidohydrolase [Jeotgalibacillus proteolyticus]PPA69376.1 amidohydrolase [Jeotgalibacillus proteolyticus]
MPNDHPIKHQADQLASQLKEWRRTLHQCPELSFQEYETARIIAGALEKMDGVNVERGIGLETSVVGTLTSGEGPVIAIRADIDALPINEENAISYRSRNNGIMHACGHDAHAAILLGVAAILSKAFKKGEIKGTVKFVFQPAEEKTDEKGLSGSPYLLQAGVYNGVEAAIALHMCPWLPVGQAQVNDGFSMANVDVFEGKIFGTGGHGAYPELGTDPIWMLGPVMQAIHGIVARKISALDSAVVSIGQIHAGTASNIIPTEVLIEGTLRSYSPEVRHLLEVEIRNAFSIVHHLGGDFSLTMKRGEPALNNSALVNRWLTETMLELYPGFHLTNRAFGLGGEDFGYVTQKLPGAMFFLGCARQDGLQRDLHTPIFDINEDCLPIGTAVLSQTAIKCLKREFSLHRDLAE